MDRWIAALADRQHGVISAAQLRAFGLGAGAIEYRVSIGRLHRIHRGVYPVGRSSLTTKGHLMAAVLACGPGAVLSHRSAAALWRIGRDWWKTDVRVPGDRRSRGTITLHRGKLEAADVTTVDGIPVTTVARTLLDLAGVLSRQQLIRAIESAERRQLFDLSRTTAPATRRCRARAIEAYGSPTGGSTLIPKGSRSCSPS